MAYQSTKPLANDPLSQSQGDIAGNFTAIKTLVDINHETFDIGNEGKHLKVDLTDQTAAPPTSAANEVTLYSNAGQLCLSKNGGAEIDYTTVTLAATGRCKLPCGLEMKWGTGTLAAVIKSVVVTFAVAFTANCYNVQLTTSNQQNQYPRDWVCSAITISNAGFTATRSNSWKNSTVTFMWFAIGD